MIVILLLLLLLLLLIIIVIITIIIIIIIIIIYTFSIYTLSDFGDSSNLIASLSRTMPLYSPL